MFNVEKVYEFAYDTVKGRRQLGVIGSELESVLPEAVDVVRSQAFKNPDTTPGAPALVKVRGRERERGRERKRERERRQKREG